MIIKRRFELIGVLVERDKDAEKIFIEEMLEQYKAEEKIRDIINRDYGVFIYLADMGACIRNIDRIRERLNELDKIKPYDNGLTYKDVTSVKNIYSREGNATVLCMLSEKGEYTRIAEIIAVDHEEGKTKMIRPWNIEEWIF